MEWKKNNSAHAFTWLNLIALYQLPRNTAFADAEDFKTHELLFYTSAGSQQMKEARARQLADTLDRMYRLLQGAKMEQGKTSTLAKKGMVELLLKANGTVGLLGNLVDEFYLFHTENN